MSFQQKRVQLIEAIVQKDPARYGYLTTEPFAGSISWNYQAFPDSFLEALLKSMQEFEGYHGEVMMDDPNNRLVYHQFTQLYGQCYQYMVQVQGYQVAQFGNQQGYLNAQNSEQSNREGNERCWRGKEHHRGYHRHKHEGKHEGEWHRKQGKHHGHHGHHHEHSGHKHGHHHRKHPHGHTHQHVNKFQEQSHSSSNSHSHQRRHRSKQKHKRAQKHGKQQFRHQSKRQQDPNVEFKKVQDQMKAVSCSVSEEQANFQLKVEEKVQPKPARYSFKEIREFIQQWKDENNKFVNRQLIEQVNTINSWQRKEECFEQKDEQEVSQQQLKQDKIDQGRKAVCQVLDSLEKSNISQSVERVKKVFSESRELLNFVAQQFVRVGCLKPQTTSVYATFASKLLSIFNEANRQQKEPQNSNKNPFQVKLTAQVQQRFRKELYETPKLKDQNEKEHYVEDSRRRVLGVVALISKLIRKRAIKRRIARVCIEGLVLACLERYYSHRKRAKLSTSNYWVYFEGLVEFIIGLGRGFELINRDSQRGGQEGFDGLYRKVTDLIDMRTKPEQEELLEFDTICANDIITIVQVIDYKVVRRQFPKISGRVVRLTQLREKNWDVKQCKVDESSTDLKEHGKTLREKVRRSIKEWDKEELGLFYEIVGEYSEFEYMTEYFLQLTRCERQQVEGRILLLRRLLQMKPTLSNVKSAWFRTLERVADGFSGEEWNVEALSRAMTEIAVGWHEAREYLVPRGEDVDLKRLVEGIVAWSEKR